MKYGPPKKLEMQRRRGGGTDGVVVQESLVLRINHEKFLVLFRNAELVSLAEQRLGRVSALVYREFLKRIEPKILRCQDNAGEAVGTTDGDESPQKR